MAVLALGLLQAYISFTNSDLSDKTFSAYDPSQVSPQASLKSLLTSQGMYEFIVSLLSFNPADKAKDALSLDDSTNSKAPSGAPTLYKFTIIADSHKDYTNLAKALKQSKELGAKFIIGIGDLSDVGTLDELKKTKEQYDLSGLPYYMAAGDHDLWDSRDKTSDPMANFRDVFGNTYQSFSYGSTRLILINNADNYLGIDELQMKWIGDELRSLDESSKTIFVVADIPLYHPSSDHVMGKSNQKLKAQAEHLLSLFKKYGVDEVISADTHFFSRYKEPTTELSITTAGAVTSDRNPQPPRFALVDIYEDGGYNIQSIEVR